MIGNLSKENVMKKERGWMMCLILAGVISVSGCKDDNTQPHSDSPYLGTWKGTTAVGDSLKFTLSDVDGKAMVTAYDVKVRLDIGGGNFISQGLSGTNSAGYGEVADSKVSFTVEPVTVNATFKSATQLEGTYSGELQLSQAPLEIKGSFTATKVR